MKRFNPIQVAPSGTPPMEGNYTLTRKEKKRVRDYLWKHEGRLLKKDFKKRYWRSVEEGLDLI